MSRPRAPVLLLAVVGVLMVAWTLATPRVARRVEAAAEPPAIAVMSDPATATRIARDTPTAVPDTPTPVDTPVPPSATPTVTVAAPSATATATGTPTSTPAATATREAAEAVPILMYHYIRENPDPRDRIGYGLSVAPDLFRAHMEYLAESGYKAVPLRELTITRKTIALTFDDGYRDFYTEAWPVLRERGFRATIYQISDLVGNWRYLTVDQLRELVAAGNEVGSHTLSHPDLTALGPDRLRRELTESRIRLERLVGEPVLAFCYPSGRQNAAVRKAVDDAGYTSAVTVEPGLYRGTTDKLQIPRVRVYGGMGLAQLARAIGQPPPDAARWGAYLRDRATG